MVTGEGGEDVTRRLRRAVHERALDECAAHCGAERAYLKERSPSCGVRQTHVGNELVDGPGVTAELLARAGIEVRGVEGRRDEE